MRAMIRFGAAFLAAGLLVVPHAAYPGIPVTALSDSQPVPTLAPVIKRIAAGVVSITIRAPAAAKTSAMDDDPLLRELLGTPVTPLQMQTFAAGSGVIIDAAKGLIVT